MLKRERTVTVMVFMMVLAFLAAWGPYAVVCILRMAAGVMPSPAPLGFSMACAKTSTCVNPIVYVLLNRPVKLSAI